MPNLAAFVDAVASSNSNPLEAATNGTTSRREVGGIVQPNGYNPDSPVFNNLIGKPIEYHQAVVEHHPALIKKAEDELEEKMAHFQGALDQLGLEEQRLDDLGHRREMQRTRVEELKRLIQEAGRED